MPTVTPGLDACILAFSPRPTLELFRPPGSRGTVLAMARRWLGLGGGDRRVPEPPTTRPAPVFTPRQQPPNGPDRDLCPELDRALREGDVVAYYQPIVELDTGTLRTVETLARWPRPSGLTLPEVFLPVVARAGLLPLLTEHMLRVGAGQLARWRAQGRGGQLRVAVNVPPLLIVDPGFVDLVQTVLAEVGLPPDGLLLEITEEAIPGGLDAATRVVAALRETGIQVALDDVGAGCSSLAVLHRLPVDAVKLDKCLVHEVDTDPHLRRLVGGLVSLSRDLGLTVVAEGIQREGQAQVLRDLGCALGQGYLFGTPVPHQGCEPWLTRAVPAPSSGVVEAGHHAGLHVECVVAVQHPCSGVVGESLDLQGSHRWHDHRVLAQPGAPDGERVPVQVHRVQRHRAVGDP
jgi:EAL domain-containing protein (putative c-di-GMP-specific phosphodiesterase class I)